MEERVLKEETLMKNYMLTIGKRYLTKRKGKRMPIKISKSQKVRDRQTGRVSTTHYYAKCTSTKELKDMMDNPSTKPKIKQKCRNELTRRMK